MRPSTSARPHRPPPDPPAGHGAAASAHTSAPTSTLASAPRLALRPPIRPLVAVGLTTCLTLGLTSCTTTTRESSTSNASPSTTTSATPSSTASNQGATQGGQPASVLPTDLGTIATAPVGAPPDEDIPPESGPLPTWDDASRAAVVQAATATMTAFAQPGADHDTWWAGLREHVTPESAPDLVLIDPANIPASRVTGDGRITADTSAAVASVVVPTESGEWTLTMVRASGVDPWLADRITPPAGQH